MRKSYSSSAKLSLALLFTLLLGSSLAQAKSADWEIDPEHFSIGFDVNHVGYQQQLGLFLEGSGSFRYDPDTRELSAGRVEIRADSIFTNHIARDKHLRSSDFLNVELSPVIVFEATSFTPGDGDTSGTLAGNLTLLAVTHPVVLRVIINKQAKYPFGHRRETLGISAHTTITRSEWGMGYGVANKLVGDEVTLRFEFEALRQ